MIGSDAARALLGSARRATLATLGPDGPARLVPVCFAVDTEAADLVLWIPLDQKPKTVPDPRALARVRDIGRDARVTLLVDHWSEDWSALAWVRLEGIAALVEPPIPRSVVAALLARYPQYATHDLPARPAIRVTVERVVSWDAQNGTERALG